MRKKIVQTTPTDQSIEALIALLRQLAPKAHETQIWNAAAFACRWIDQYRDAVSGTQEVKHLLAERAGARKELQALERAIEKIAGRKAAIWEKGRPPAPGLIESLSASAKEALPKSGVSIARRHSDVSNDQRYIAVRAELGDLLRMLQDVGAAVGVAIAKLAPPRQSKHLNPDKLLACGMCQTLGTVLRVKVAMTRGDALEDLKTKPASANYWKLLKRAFELAGAAPPDDLRPLMKAGAVLAYPSGSNPWGTAPGAGGKKGVKPRAKK